MTKTLIFIFLAALLTFSAAYADPQPMHGYWEIPGYFSSLAQAVDTLNFRGVGTGGVTFNVLSNQTLTAPIVITASGAYSNPVILQGNNNTIYSYPGTATPWSLPMDGFIALAGSDWVTITGFHFVDLYDTVPASMEYGIGLFHGWTDDYSRGCQHNTITNCSFSLSRAASTGGPRIFTRQEGSVGIATFGGINPYYATNVYLINDSLSESHSYNQISGNNVNNANFGIVLNGNSGFQDTENVITGNFITNFGGCNSNYPHDYIPSTGILARQQRDLTIYSNDIYSNFYAGQDYPFAIRGIYVEDGDEDDCQISMNHIRLSSADTYHGQTGIARNSTLSSTTNNVNITYNTISYCTAPMTASANSNNFIGISSTPAGSVNISHNEISHCTVPGGAFYAVLVNNTTGQTTIDDNRIFDNTYDVAGSSPLFKAVTLSGAGNITNNQIHDLQIPNILSASSGQIYLIHQQSAPAGSNSVISGNQLQNVMVGSNEHRYNYFNFYGISASNTGETLISANELSNLYYYANYGFELYGIHAAGTVEIARNELQDIGVSGPQSMVYGIYAHTSGNKTIHNNMISRLYAPTNYLSVIGIYLGNGTLHNVHYNSIYLDAAGLNPGFASTCLRIYAPVDLRNNILVNESTPGSSGYNYAVYYSDTVQIGSNTDKNIYYSGTPDAQHLIARIGSNYYQTLAAYKAALVNRDQNSYTEDVPFVSSSNLHIPFTAVTLAANSGLVIPGCNIDFDGHPRDPLTPDIGADEMMAQAPELPILVVGDGSVALSWAPVPGATGYRVEAADDPNGTFSTVTTVTGTSFSGDTGAPRKFYRVITLIE